MTSPVERLTVVSGQLEEAGQAGGQSLYHVILLLGNLAGPRHHVGHRPRQVVLGPLYKSSATAYNQLLFQSSILRFE